jgi:hypothetical protein
LSKEGLYPLMHVVYTGATYDDGTKTLDFEVYILDLPSHYDNKTERQKEVVSDAEQCAEDVLADIANGNNIFIDDENYNVTNAVVTPLAEEGSNVLAGVLLDLSIEIPYDRSACDAPIDGVLPEGGGFVYQRRGLLRVLTQNGAVDVASVNTIRVTNGTLIDEGGGIVSIDTGGVELLRDLTDVNLTEAPLDREALVYDEASNEWIAAGPAKLDFPVFNPSGTAIPIGKVVRFNGAVQGDRPCIVLASATGLDPKTIVGITSERIEGNSPGHVRPFGTIYQVNTSGYSLGAILYISTTAGELTPLVTTAPTPRIPIAVVTRVHVNTGRIFVRTWSPGYKLGELGDVGLTAPPQLNEVLTFDGSKWTTRSLSSIPIVSGTPPPGGFKGVFYQDAAGDLTADNIFTYNSTTNVVTIPGIVVTTINGRTAATDYAKLDGIQAGAEVNVNADWNASIGDAAILNKPTLAAVATSGAYSDLTGIPSLVASVGATAPITSTGGTTPTIAINAATTSAAGSMSAADKTKLDGIAAGAQVNANAFGTIVVAGSSNVVADNPSGTLTLVAGSNITLTSNAGTDAVTIAATGSTGVASVTGTAPIVSSGGANPAISITAATTSAAGSMSSSDKTKLDGIASGAEVNQNAFSNIAVSGQGTIAADSKTDTLTFIAGSNVTITTNTTNDEITINASGGGGGSSYSVVRQQSGTSYTLQLTDAGAYIQTTSTTAVTITIPLQSSVTWAADTEIYFEQNNTGQITIAGASGVTINSSETLKTFARYSVIAAKRVASNVWTLTGERALV